jgi:molybdopterin molybdotransferase
MPVRLLQMTLFLKTVPVDEAIRTARSLATPPPIERVCLEDAGGRVLAGDITADIDIPGFSRSTVDGYALKASDTIGASESLPALLRIAGTIGMGECTNLSVERGSCIYVPTGGSLPEGADAMAMIEYTERIGDEVLVRKAMAPGDNITARGEDFSKGEIVLSPGRLLSPREIGVLAAVGRAEIPVFRRPVVGVISTGNELVPVTSVPDGGRVRDINSFLVSAFLHARGCIPVNFGIVRDERDLLREKLGEALSRCEAVILSGGSSKDERDITADLIRERGEVLIHGISIAPGKPTIIGKSGGKPVIGLPGHPASAYVVLLAIVLPLLEVMTGRAKEPIRSVTMTLAENIPSARGREDYVRVRISNGTAVPEFGKSGLLNTLIRSDGLVRIPAGKEGLEEGEVVEVLLW